MRMTPARARWLSRLAKGPARRNGTVVGYQCMALGWTTWQVTKPTPPQYVPFPSVDMYVEELTEAGRAALANYEGSL